ncbi:Gmad2 immunoglobulin-like domain-containing protein [Patescibacteria group bacterium]|nr:Gmad2 immunoglobulin-like domain-containing protein [Patescibacteria group bacterium]MBU1727793.1 Gmad2 immunoglobulin-like domain-containing protein [Patescibacteria group bacterium]
MTNFGKLVFALIIITLLSGTVFLLNRKPKVEIPTFVDPIVEENESVPVENREIGFLGNKDDLVSFSINAGSLVSGFMPINGVVQGGYFFEGNIIVRVLDANKNVLKTAYGTATTEWMTTGPVSFHTTLDFSGLPAGPGYIEIHNDNASGLPENDRLILIPVVIQ